MKYSSLIEQLRNDKAAYVNKINSRTSKFLITITNYNYFKNEFNKRDTELKTKREEALSELNARSNSKQIEFNELKAEEKVIRNTRFMRTK
ncbi:MAG: hypothetical protein IPH32_16325 [Bacteroidetes bacterium]|nr:hypothetical protein [Bacteroidota bacterium]